MSTGEGWGEGPGIGRALFELIAVFVGVLFPLFKAAPWQEAAGRDGSHPCPWLCPGIPDAVQAPEFSPGFALPASLTCYGVTYLVRRLC